MTDTAEQNLKIIKMPSLWPARFRITILTYIIIATLAIGTVILQQKIIQSQLQNFRNSIVDYIGHHGFELQDIIISGRNRTTLAEINNTLQLSRGDNFFNINTKQIKQNLENLPWIRDVTIKRSFFPNIIQIAIKEKEVIAIWQLNQKFYPLDFNGYVIEADYYPDKPILLVIGEEAPEHLNELLQTIRKTAPEYLSRLKAATYVSKRRWNLTFDNISQGITVKLPTENYANALSKLINLDKTSAILKRKLTIIDLRLPDRVTVKMRKGIAKVKSKPQAL